MISYEEVGRRVRQARQELGLMQADLGRLLSKPRSHAAVSDIERGKTKLDLEELGELAQLLQKPLAYFIDPGPSPGVEYRRSEPDGSAEQQRHHVRSVDAFKQVARDQARRRAEGDRR